MFSSKPSFWATKFFLKNENLKKVSKPTKQGQFPDWRRGITKMRQHISSRVPETIVWLGLNNTKSTLKCEKKFLKNYLI